MNALERLGYANGQRLEAGDLRLEQRYHIDVRRLLNRGLFTPGVVSGLEVAAVAGQPRQVLVKTGIALDPVGRELVLRQETTVDVPNQRPVENPLGYFLIIRYAEQQVPATDPWCGTAEGPPRVARVREQPELVWSEHVPAHGNCASGAEGLDCGIVLALVVLDGACKVAQIQSVVREYSHPTHASQVQAIAFEGEKDIDPDNPKVLHFKIRGGAAQSAALFLWGGPFSSLYYTELGRHNHGFGGTTQNVNVDHQHGIPATDSTAGGGGHDHGTHGHGLIVDKSYNGGFLGPQSVSTHLDPLLPHTYVYAPGLPAERANLVVPTGLTSDGPHGHTVPSRQTDSIAPSTTHGHNFGGTSANGGATGSPNGLPYQARSGNRREFLGQLQVAFDDQDITQIVIDRYAPQTWNSLGDGSPNHGINSSGTGVIDLMDVAAEVGIDMGQEDHSLTFSVKSGGGKVLYNLYVS